MGYIYPRVQKRKPPKLRTGVYQDRNDPTRLIAEAHSPKAQAAIAATLKAWRKTLPLVAIADRIRARDLMGVPDEINSAALADQLRPAFEPIADAYRASLVAATVDINTKLATVKGKPTDPFVIDSYSKNVQKDLSDMQTAMIAVLTDDLQAQVFAIVALGLSDGLSPEEITTRVVDVVGLSPQFSRAIETYRTALESNNTGLLDVVGPISQEKVDELVSSYTDRALDYRAKLVADTETNRAANLALQESYSQAIKSGKFPDAAVKKFWMVALDEKVCVICLGIAEKYQYGAAINEQFENVGVVGVPPAHPNCRCTIEVRVDLDMTAQFAEAA